MWRFSQVKVKKLTFELKNIFFILVGKIKQTLGNAQLSSSFFDAFSIDRGFNSFNNKIIPGFD